MAQGQNLTVALCPRLSVFASSLLLRSSTGLIKIPALPQQMLRTALRGTGGGHSKTPPAKAMFFRAVGQYCLRDDR